MPEVTTLDPAPAEAGRPARPAAGLAGDALDRLVGDGAGFLADDLGRRPRVIRDADPLAFADLLDLDAVDHLVAATALRTPSFRLVTQGTTLPTSRVTRRARIGSRPVTDLIDVAAVHREFAAGATLVLQGLHRSHAPVAAFCRSLEARLTHKVQANAYLTPPIAQGLHLHGDPHDVFAVQTHGVKRWVVEPDGEPCWEFELEPGDVLYLPAGVRHAAQTIERPSLHLTIGVRTTTWREVAERAIARAVEAADLAGSLPGGWAQDPAAHAAGLHDAIQDVLAQLQRPGHAEAVLEAAADAFWGTRPPDLSGGLRDLLVVDHLDDRATLQVRPDASCRLRERGERLTLVLGDRRISAPAAVRPAVERMRERGTFRPADLDDLLDADSRRVLCRRLVREGWLTVVDAGDEGA